MYTELFSLQQVKQIYIIVLLASETYLDGLFLNQPKL